MSYGGMLCMVMVWCRGATETEDTTTTNLICDRSYTQQDVAQDNWRLLLLTRGTLFNRGQGQSSSSSSSWFMVHGARCA
jgi:hypothetical protein